MHVVYNTHGLLTRVTSLSNDVMGPVYQTIPAFLKETNYRNPTDGMHTAFQYAWKTDLSIFGWFQDHPFEASHFNNFMKAQRMSTPNCFSFFKLDEMCQGCSPDEPVFVDIGGGIGHQCAALLQKFPNLPGKVILQDLPAVTAEAKVPPRVQVMAHDFFTTQPVKGLFTLSLLFLLSLRVALLTTSGLLGAKFYYLRAILHDYSDDASLKILKHIYDAMGPESVLLLDEIALPTENVDWYATQTDMTMMVGNASMERTVDAWSELLDKAEMKIRNITMYTYAFRLSVIEVVKKTEA